jgi:hypothetical protein
MKRELLVHAERYRSRCFIPKDQQASSSDMEHNEIGYVRIGKNLRVDKSPIFRTLALKDEKRKIQYFVAQEEGQHLGLI